MKNYFFTPVLFFISITLIFAQDDKSLTDATLNKNKIESHIRFLTADEMRGRDTPSPEQLIAARYLASQLQSFGVKPLPQYPDYLQPVQMKTQSIPSEVKVSYNNKVFNFKEHTLALEGKNTNLDGDAVFVNYGLKEDFDKIDVKGKIVFAICGDGVETSSQKWYAEGKEKIKRATAKGAIALIEFYNNAQLPWNYLVNYFSREGVVLDANKAGEGSDLLHIWMSDAGFAEANFWKTQKKMKTQIAVKGMNIKKFTTYNVVGYTEGSDTKLKEEYVIYSAHYDHVGIGTPDEKGDSIYNGARDNAIGTVTVLSVAENIAKYPTKRSALYIMFTGEEKGLLGSQWFVENSPIDLKKLTYCFNSDNGGYNDTSLATIIGLGRTTADTYIVQACQTYGLKAIDDPAPEQGLFDRSDNVNFARKGIPAPTFSLGFKAFDAEIGKYYHQPGDDANSLNYNYLFKFFGSYIYASRLIANAAETPYWKKGDKYYDAGQKLYGKK